MNEIAMRETKVGLIINFISRSSCINDPRAIAHETLRGENGGRDEVDPHREDARIALDSIIFVTYRPGDPFTLYRLPPWRRGDGGS